MSKKVKDLTIGELKEICDKNHYYDKYANWRCNHNCPLRNIEHICSGEMSDLKEKDLNQKVEIEENE